MTEELAQLHAAARGLHESLGGSGPADRLNRSVLRPLAAALAANPLPTTTPLPTASPAATTTPVPTTTPLPTASPAATTAPVPTTKAAPTPEPAPPPGTATL